MQPLKAFLERFKHLTPPEALVKNAIVQALQELFQITVAKEQIRIGRDYIFLDSPPLLKGEIYLRKEELLRRVHEILGRIKFKDVR
jgi:hypothetical protein